MENRSLTEIMHEIVLIAEGSNTAIHQCNMNRWPQGALEFFQKTGILQRGSNAKHVYCNECEEHCSVIPLRRALPNGERVLMHVCGQFGYAEYIHFSFESLNTWQICLDGFATMLAQTLGLDNQVRTLDENRFWHLGSLKVGPKTKRFYLGRGFHSDDSVRLCGIADEYVDENSILFVFDRKPMEYEWPDPEGAVICLSDAISIKNGTFAIDNEELDRVLGKKRKIVPFRLPPSAAWPMLRIWILPPEYGEEEPTRIKLQIGRRTEIRSFVEMGMFDDRSNPAKPNSAWYLLLLLARHGGVLGWNDEGAGEKARSHIKLLRKKLREVFRIAGNPIEEYNKKEGWKTVFYLVDLPAAA